MRAFSGAAPQATLQAQLEAAQAAETKLRTEIQADREKFLVFARERGFRSSSEAVLRFTLQLAMTVGFFVALPILDRVAVWLSMSVRLSPRHCPSISKLSHMQMTASKSAGCTLVYV